LGLKESPAPSFQVAAFEIEDVDLPAFYQREEVCSCSDYFFKPSLNGSVLSSRLRMTFACHLACRLVCRAPAHFTLTPCPYLSAF
jgi:hypothetical protein